MFKIEWNDLQKMHEETDRCVKYISGIGEYISFKNEIYHTKNDDVCFGDNQIDAISFFPPEKKLTVRIKGYYNNHACFVVIDFFDVEIQYMDIAPEHYIDDMFIQQNSDGKFSISFGSGELDFRYAYAKLNRFWTENI